MVSIIWSLLSDHDILYNEWYGFDPEIHHEPPNFMSIRAIQQNYEQEHTAQRKLQSGADKRRYQKYQNWIWEAMRKPTNQVFSQNFAHWGLF